MITVTRIFKGLPDNTRKAIINQMINVQGLKSPRTKAAKDYDKIRGTNQPRRGEQNFLPCLFEVSVRQHM